MKTCKACGKEKPYSEFHKNPNSKSGLSGFCKSCHLKASLEHKGKKVKVDPGTELEGMKRCKACGNVKPLEKYYFNPAFEDNKNPSCVPCHIEACKTPQRLKPRFCVVCGSKYVPRSKNQKYCTYKCSNKFWNSQ